MTKIVEKYMRQVETERVLRIVCDRCGVDIPRVGLPDTRDFELEFTKGTSYGSDGGDKAGWRVPHLCDDCVGWLRKTLEDGGVTIETIKTDW